MIIQDYTEVISTESKDCIPHRNTLVGYAEYDNVEHLYIGRNKKKGGDIFVYSLIFDDDDSAISQYLAINISESEYKDILSSGVLNLGDIVSKAKPLYVIQLNNTYSLTSPINEVYTIPCLPSDLVPENDILLFEVNEMAENSNIKVIRKNG